MAARGYRVILPDQIGFCKSTKPVSYQFTLHQLAKNILGLIQTIGVNDITLVGHSLGGMTAVRFALLYPQWVRELVLTNPLGLEDWMEAGIPYPDTDYVWSTEASSSYGSIRGYETANYYVGSWQPAYDTWVYMLLDVYGGSKAKEYTWNQALVTDMVLTETIVYEFARLKPPTLMLIGAKDVTAIGKAWAPAAVQAAVGHYNVLAPKVVAQIPNGTLVLFPDEGHAPQISNPTAYHAALFGWLS